MSAAEYWDGDPHLAVEYRKAEQIRAERRNYDHWLQGMYIYDALCDASPLFRAFGKKGTKAHPYPKMPYAISEAQAKHKEEMKEKQNQQKGLRMMEQLMASVNKKFKEKEVGKDADH